MDFRVCSLLRERVFGEPLASCGLPLWLHYSGFQASCHNIAFTHFNLKLYEKQNKTVGVIFLNDSGDIARSVVFSFIAE
jgi:hypothetical protein